MALTITMVKENKGITEDVHIYDVVFDTAYPTGGETVTPSNFNLSEIHGMELVDKKATAADNREVTYNPSTGKLVVWTDIGTQATGEVAASATLASDGTEPADAATVTINDVTYRFKNTMALVNDVKRSGVDSDTDLDNLIAAINGAAGSGTKYFAGTAQPTGVTAAARTGTGATGAFVATATTAGSAGNSYASTETSTHLSFTNGATFTSGSDGSDQSAVQVRAFVFGRLR